MAIVKKYPSRVVYIENKIKGVYTLIIESLGKPFKYDPGQFLHLALEEYNPSEQWPESRCFSMQSSPDQSNIKITYAVKGSFTSRMEKQLRIGSEITLKLPYGNMFTIPHNKEKTVFIAGGTGITPFLSLFTHDSFKEYTNPQIYLGFRSKPYNIYNEELNSVKYCEPHIYYEDIDGTLDILHIFSKNSVNCDYFISGPPKMINDFKNALIIKGVNANQILTDDWE
jgi:predicted ferric reductase